MNNVEVLQEWERVEAAPAASTLEALRYEVQVDGRALGDVVRWSAGSTGWNVQCGELWWPRPPASLFYPTADAAARALVAAWQAWQQEGR